jgi:hypothetical protein
VLPPPLPGILLVLPPLLPGILFGAAFATACILLVLPALLPGFLLVLPPPLPGILLVLPALLPGSYWCCLRHYLVSYWCCLRYCLVFYACSAALLPGIQLVLPVLVITAMPVDYRIKERNVRMHLLPAFKNLLITEVNTLFLFFGIICILNHILPVKHIINYKYYNCCFNRLYRLFLAGRSSEG